MSKTNTKETLEAVPVPTDTAPTPQAAVSAVPDEGPGFRVPEYWRRLGRGKPRPKAPLDHAAMLVRGISYTMSYSDGPVVFQKGERVPCTEGEYQYLAEAVDRVDFNDGTSRILRSIRKFRFFGPDGEAITLDPIPDKVLGQAGRDMWERAEIERRFEGDDRVGQ